MLPRWWYAAVNKLPGPPVHWFWGSLYPYLSGSSNALTIVQDDVNDMLYVGSERHWQRCRSALGPRVCALLMVLLECSQTL